MKPIKIAPSNAIAITDALAAVNGRAAAFTVTSYYDVASAATDADARLLALPAAARKGARAWYIPAGPGAGYKYKAKSTRIDIERRASGWFLTGVAEAIVYPKQAARLSITITPDQAAEIARRAVADFIVGGI